VSSRLFQEEGKTMRLIYDRNKIQESVDAKGYDDRNLTICKCGKHRYPSKLMFIRFLERFVDVKGVADIWSESDVDTGKVKIHVVVEYKVFKDRKKEVHHE
jgi:hypothetical protein